MMTTPTRPTALRQTILIHIESKQFAQSLKRALESNGLHGNIVDSETAVFEEVKTSVPSLIIIDRRQRTANNLQRLRTLSNAPIVAVEDTGTCSEDECLQD